MSHYTVCKTQLKDKEAIIAALARMGFDSTKVEISDKALPLKMYNGRGSGRNAHIRVKGHGWGEASHLQGWVNDIGFEMLENGQYEVHLDGSTRYENRSFEKALTDYYSAELVKRKARQQGLFIAEEKEANNEITIKLRSFT